ncbi:MFS transporter [Streptomyces marianii]|uniref:MFS transporter n=1 Tax=Streptomyces marianii TaxID=1817406 RepID=A0A5R9EB83_9ACTN|nr:MFS transporter [Streptomyces marianii]TLQ47186.1 MFS transporter [Streptomyces marianii]
MTSTEVMPRRRAGLALGVLAGALALDVSGLGVLNAALPAVGKRFNLDDTTLQWVMIAYAVTFAGFLLVGGRLADVFGRRRVFEFGIALFTVAALVGAVAPDIGWLLGARAVQGIGAALSGPAALALLTEVFPAGPARNRALGVYAAVGAASFSGGVLLGGVLTQFLGWRSVLWFSVVVGVTVLAVTRAGLPAGVGRGGRLDLPGAILGTIGLALLVVGASTGGMLAGASLCLAVVFLLLFVVREGRTADPALPLDLFRVTSVRSASLAAFLQYMASVGMLFFAPLYMQGMLNYSPLESGLALVPMSACVFLTANFVTGRLLTKYAPRTLMTVGLVLIGAGTALWITTPHEGDYLLHVLPGMVLSGIGQGLNFPAMTSAALSGIEPERHAVAGAVNVVAQQIGASIGVAVMVLIAATSDDRLSGYHLAYLAAGAGCVLGAVIVAMAGRGASTA